MKNLVDPFTRAMFGIHAVHVPINLIIQGLGDESKVAGVFQTQLPGVLHPLHFGHPDANHLLIMGDCVIRPRMVVKTNHLMGAGYAGLAMSGFDVDEWVRHGEVVLDPTKS